MLDPLTRVGSEFIYYGAEGCNLTPDWFPGLHVPVLEFCFHYSPPLSFPVFLLLLSSNHATQARS